MEKTFKIKVAPGIFYHCTAANGDTYSIGQKVVIQYDKYEDCGVIEHVVSDKDDEMPETGQQSPATGGSGRQKKRQNSPLDKTEVGTIIRHLNSGDQEKIQEKESRESSMLRTAARKVNEHNLTMKIIGCHYTFDRKLVIFQFTADGRIDFRELVRDLAGALHARVELRQIGVRDEAAIVGGLAVCGRTFCCCRVLDNFASVNVKTAKTQHLSLNPSSVSGSCGRLKCCLRYEVDWYRDAFKEMPRQNSRCETPQGPGKVIDCNALSRKVRVALDGDGPAVAEFTTDEITPL